MPQINFNDNLDLWKNAKASKIPYKLVVNNGHVFNIGDGCLARFTNDDEATKTLIAAGFKKARGQSYFI